MIIFKKFSGIIVIIISLIRCIFIHKIAKNYKSYKTANQIIKIYQLKAERIAGWTAKVSPAYAAFLFTVFRLSQLMIHI